MTADELNEVEAKEKKERDDMGRLRQARNQGINETKQKIALNLLQTGINIEQVASITDLPLEIVQSLANE